MKITFAEPDLPKAGAVVVGVQAGRKLTPAAKSLDGQTAGALSRALGSGKFTGKTEQLLDIVAPAGVGNSRILLAGLGKEMDELAQQALGGRVAAHLNRTGEKEAALVLDAGAADLSAAAAQIALGARLKGYRFDKYRTKEEAENKPSLKKLVIHVAGAAAARRAYATLDKVADGVFFTRDLVSEPANVLYPASFAEQAKGLERLGVKVEVLGEKQMRKLGMNALLGVGQGSVRESQLVVMQWNGAARSKAPVALVGKGVTFDTGGISIKPAQGMEEMKWDMGGAGAVVGTMMALAGRKAKANVVGIIGLVENMPDAAAQRPGDVVKSANGQTIEVINTDAEGRLVLADALWYAQTKFKPQCIVDLATLTGAIIVSLGYEHAGLFSNDDALGDRLVAAGKTTGEKVWRMPLDKAYDKLLNSDIADMKNIGGRHAGSITAAQFLQRFVDATPWAHLNIAGMSWANRDLPTSPNGASGYGVRLLDRLVSYSYEV